MTIAGKPLRIPLNVAEAVVDHLTNGWRPSRRSGVRLPNVTDDDVDLQGGQFEVARRIGTDLGEQLVGCRKFANGEVVLRLKQNDCVWLHDNLPNGRARIPSANALGYFKFLCWRGSFSRRGPKRVWADKMEKRLAAALPHWGAETKRRYQVTLRRSAEIEADAEKPELMTLPKSE